MLRAMKSDDPFRAQFTVEKLGAIEHAELTIRPLTLFFGPNGTNKTWAAYALYGLLRRYHVGLGESDDSVDAELVSVVDGALDQMRRSQADSPEVSARASFRIPRPNFPFRIAGPAIAKLLGLSQDELVFGSAALRFDAASLLPEEANLEVRAAANDETLVWNLSGPRLADIPPSPGGTLEFRATVGTRGSVRDLVARVQRYLTRLSHSILALPAERKALLTLHRQLATLSTYGRRAPAEDPTMPLSVSLMVDRLRGVASAMDEVLPLPAADFIREIDAMAQVPWGTSPGPLRSLSGRLQSLLGGRLEFEASAVRDGPRTLRFSSAEAELPIQSTHSLLRSLGGLDLYLRHRAQRGDFVFIDEPEMNAHPETQVAIAEFIALMVNAGLRVVATTHSPYIIDHLHNLIEADRLAPDAQARFADHFKLKTADAFISADKVAAYHFGRDGEVTDAFDRSDRVIDWSILGDDSDDIANLYSELLGAQLDE